MLQWFVQLALARTVLQWFVQVAEEEADNLSVPAEEEDEELVDESMDEGEGGLPSLGKRRSTDTAFSAQTAPKRARPGSLAEVSSFSLLPQELLPTS